jgi:mannose-6-phosphate isomerase-like protein (cupin superfamily)
MIVKANQAKQVNTEKPKGGAGIMAGLSYLRPDFKPDGSRFCMVAKNSIPVGGAIGFHKHPEDEEIYFIVQGSGIYQDNEKAEHPVSVGDMTVCPKGQCHGIINNGTEPLVFIGIIAA